LTATLAATRVQFAFKILTGLATAVGTAAILLLGANRVLHGRATVGELLVFLSHLGSLYGPPEALIYTPPTSPDEAGRPARGPGGDARGGRPTTRRLPGTVAGRPPHRGGDLRLRARAAGAARCQP